MTARRIVVLSAADEDTSVLVSEVLQLLAEAARLGPATTSDPEGGAVFTPVTSGPLLDWNVALDEVEAADVLVAIVTAGAVADRAWRRLAAYAAAMGAGTVVVVADDTPLIRWPTSLRDAMPPTVDARDLAWRPELVRAVTDAAPSRPQGWSAPARPAAPTPDETAPGVAPAGGDDGDVRMDEDVRFTVYRPAHVPRHRWSWLLVFAHTGERGDDDPLAEVERQAAAVLGDQAGSYGTLSTDSTGPLRRGSTVLVEPWLDGATFNPATVEFRWEEPVHRADFRFRMGDGGPATARGGVRIFVGAVLVGEVALTVRVGEAEAAPHPLRTSTRRFRKVFASYSHADTEVVEAVANAVRLLGDEYLIDAHELRSGEDWQQRIGQLIEDADVFQLFWSSNALRSRHVLAECRHALSLQREGFIRPVYWQEPLPQDPERDLPPTPIRRLHFSRLAAESPTEAASPALPLPPPPVLPEPARPRTAGPPASRRSGRRLPRWTAVAGALVVAAGVGVVALEGGRERPDSSPGVRPTDTETAEPPTTRSSTSDVPTSAPSTTGASTGATFDRAVAYLGAHPLTGDPSCRLSAANPALGDIASLEEVGVECRLSAPTSGAPVQFRAVVLRPGVAVERYLDGLARVSGLRVIGGSLPADPGGPYLDVMGANADGTSYSCRVWSTRPVDEQTAAVAIACAGLMSDVIDLWRQDTA